MAPNLTLRSSNFLIRRLDRRYASKFPGQAKIDYLRYYILWNESVGITFAPQDHLNTMKEGVSNMKITFTREGLIGLSSTILSLLLLFGLLSVTWIRTKPIRWVESQRGRMGESCGPSLIMKFFWLPKPRRDEGFEVNWRRAGNTACQSSYPSGFCLCHRHASAQMSKIDFWAVQPRVFSARCALA